jgi:hypothetical protein
LELSDRERRLSGSGLWGGRAEAAVNVVVDHADVLHEREEDD